MSKNIKWNFSDKKVLVVGNSKGIGSQVFANFVATGADVYGINSSNCDISNTDDIDRFFTYELPDELDILVNVAGINFTNKIEEVSVDEWDKVIDTNLRSFFYITKQALWIMPDGGRIVNVSSIAGRNKSIGNSGVHYTASKAGIIGLTKQIAHEVGSRDICVNAVCPSQTKTNMLAKSMTQDEIEELGKSIPLQRIAEVPEVVYPILFLCSGEASYITGTTLDVNGGQL